MARGPPDLSKGLILVGNKMCPFAQRAWFCLEESGLTYTHRECELYPKPQWLLDINPKGKVPVLIDEGKAVVESEVIVDLIVQKAKIDAADPERSASFRRVLNEELMPAVERGRRRADVDAALGRLDDLVLGPYVLGDALSVADISAAPMLQRLFEDDQVSKDNRKLHAWWAAVSDRPAFKKTKLARGSYWWWW
eukprot:TRINITY_DN65848_c0_g1_i1.p2 TRINITY_DN65848_c0_g1~~TRINITY_DN65848_c0_g1_i1.p2  ORF type:complete len:216 (+),score=49.87 TRINITY_DN65848_c0_g1_i1:69-650(+)